MDALLLWRSVCNYLGMQKHRIIMAFSHICGMFQCLFYFAGFIESSPSMEKIKVFEKYFTSKIHLYNKVLPPVFLLGWLQPYSVIIIIWNLVICWQDEIERQGSVLVDYADLTGDQSVCAAIPDLTTALKEQPQLMLNCLGLAIHQVVGDEMLPASQIFF